MRATRVQQHSGTTEAVKQSYEKAWTKTRATIEAQVATGDHLSSILARMGRLRFDGVRQDWWRKQPTAASLGRRVLQAYEIDDVDNRNPYYPAVIDGRYFPSSGFNPMTYLASSVQPQVTVILELGSGWSANLFGLYIHQGNKRSETLHYIGAEFTDSGRGCADRLARYDGKISYEAVPFDWTQPDLSFLERLPKPLNVLAYSHHSIEQVERIDPDVYRQLAHHADWARVVHFEPVGWQRDPSLMRRRLEDDGEFFETIERELGVAPPLVRIPRGTVDVTTTEAQLRGAAWWSWNRRYNLDLLRRVEEVDIISVGQMIFDYGSSANPFNPSTMISLNVDCS